MSESTHPLATAPAGPETRGEAPTAETMKAVNRNFITGVTVVTAVDRDKPRGLAVNAFASISLEPPTVMVCVARTSSTHDTLFRGSHMAINIMSDEQLHVVERFASKLDDKFAGLDWAPGPFGSPLLAGSSAVIEVEIRERLLASTHTIFICRAVHASVEERSPMIYAAGRFFRGAGLDALQ